MERAQGGKGNCSWDGERGRRRREGGGGREKGRRGEKSIGREKQTNEAARLPSKKEWKGKENVIFLCK